MAIHPVVHGFVCDNNDDLAKFFEVIRYRDDVKKVQVQWVFARNSYYRVTYIAKNPIVL